MTGKRMVAITYIVFVLINFSTVAQQVEIENIPDEILKTVEGKQFASSYTIDGAMNPFYLRGDFDSDGKPDYAIWVKSKVGSKTGIAIWLSSKRDFVVLGAGVPFKAAASVETNLNFLNTWQVYGKRPVERGVESSQPPRLRGEAILVGKSESASGLIYWDGTRFRWYQQGD